LYYLIKVPINLHTLVKKKLQTQTSSESGDRHLLNLQELLQKMMYAMPFLVVLSWYGLDHYSIKHTFSPSTELLHPYFMVILTIALAVTPITLYAKGITEKLQSGVYKKRDSGELYQRKQQHEVMVNNLKEKIEALAIANATFAKLEQEIKLLGREARNLGNLKEERFHRFQMRVSALLNQVEILDLMTQSPSKQEGILSWLNPLRMLRFVGILEDKSQGY